MFPRTVYLASLLTTDLGVGCCRQPSVNETSNQMELYRLHLIVWFVAFDLPASCFHLSMLIFIAAQMKHRPATFRQGFYVIYVAVSVVDLYFMLSVRAILRQQLCPNHSTVFRASLASACRFSASSASSTSRGTSAPNSSTRTLTSAPGSKCPRTLPSH